MDFRAASRICTGAKQIFARPGSWQGSGWAIDLGGKLSKARDVQAVQPISLGLFHYQPWVPNAKEFAEKWTLIAAKTLLMEIEEQESANKDYGLEVVR